MPSFLILGEFNLYTREAGPGMLHISVEGQSRGEMNIREISAGTYCVTYRVTEPGSVLIWILFYHRYYYYYCH